MQHIECCTERFRQRCLTKNLSHLHSSSSSCSQMVGQGHQCQPIKFFGRNYLLFINGGTTLYNRSLLTSMTDCFESCGTGDISSSIKLNSAIFEVSNIDGGPIIFHISHIYMYILLSQIPII